MRFFRRPALIVALGALFTNAACYAYQPAPTTPHPGRGVRFSLSREGTTELARFLGPEVVEVTGSLADVTPAGALVVAPQWVKTSNNVQQPWSGEGVVTFPREYVRSVEERTFNRRRTTLAVVSMTGGLVALAVVALKSGGAHGSSGPDTGTPAR